MNIIILKRLHSFVQRPAWGKHQKIKLVCLVTNFLVWFSCNNLFREFETKLEFEKSASKRLESQNQRLKDQIERTHKERDQNLSEKDREKSASKAAKKGLQEAREDLNDAERKLSEAKAKVVDYEAEIARLQSTNEALQQDLKLAFKRIADLQSAFEALEDSDAQLSDLSSEDEDDALS